jgi:hypothetical protein
MLHLYLRHRRDSQAYGNKWAGDSKLESITTYEAVAEYCRLAMQLGEPVRIHRRKFQRIPATICCECRVRSVKPIKDSNGFTVEFHEWKPLFVERELRLQKGWYFADPSEYEQ